VNDLVENWSRNHERWRKAIKKISKLSPEKNQEILKSMDKYHALIKQYLYQLSS